MAKKAPKKTASSETRHAAPRVVGQHRQCPSCYHGMGGVGNSYSTHAPKTYYRCDTCGHTWSVTIKHESIQVDHRTIELDTRDAS